MTDTGVLQGSGTCSGAVSVSTGGTIGMDSSIGPVFTISSLTLAAGATVYENAAVPVFEVAEVGTLTISGSTTVQIATARTVLHQLPDAVRLQHACLRQRKRGRSFPSGTLLAQESSTT